MAVSLRRIAAVIFFLAFIAATQDIFQAVSPQYKNYILSLQVVPAVLQFIQKPGWIIAGFVVILLITMLMGRLYCSTVCPLGLIQDVFSRMRKKIQKKPRFIELPNYRKTRYTIFILTLICAVSGVMLPLSLLDPFSLSGKFVNAFVQPLVVLLNNGISAAFAQAGNYNVPPYVYRLHTVDFYLISVILFAAIGYISYQKGRWFCNILCPVGTFLGILARIAPKKIKIDETACKGCGVCERVCKAGCIDTKSHQIDFERCVVCYNCIDVCPTGVIYQNKKNLKPVTKKKPVTVSRKGFLGIGAVLALQGIQQKAAKKETGESRIAVNRKVPVTPPGSGGVERFTELCTACQQCTGQCPSLVLQPSFTEYGFLGIMQPVMNFSFGYCNFECTLCTEICPTGALLPLHIKEKKLKQLGKVTFVKDNCIVETKGTECGACSEHCPTKAVTMVPYKNLKLPEIKEKICIGCGACEYACPVKPYKAIYVEGNKTHCLAESPSNENATQKEAVPEEFPF